MRLRVPKRTQCSSDSILTITQGGVSHLQDLDVVVEVMLASEYLPQSEEILKAVIAHADKWSTQVDVLMNRRKPAGRSSDFYDDCSYTGLLYAQHPGIFEGKSYRITAKLGRPYEPKTCTIEARVRIGNNLYDAPWSAPWVDSREVCFFKKR